MKKGIIIFLLFLMAAPVFVGAQSERPKSNVFKPSRMFEKPKGFLNYLIDPSKFSMSHSYSLSYFSIGNRSLNQGLYLNTMNYRFSDPLLMQVRIGFLHQPFGGVGMTNGMSGKLFIQRAMLQYKPSDKMSLTIDYQVLPASTRLPYYYRW
jgi:hypothetical protein